MAARRRFRTAAMSLVSVAVVVSCGSCTSGSQQKHTAYCAIMPDSVGLFVDNEVTQMGVKIGKVSAITPETLDVRVDFTVNHRELPAGVEAVTRSPSILADRSLELVGNYDSGPKLARGGCIPLNRSFTPKSLSEVIGSATDFINAINPQGSTNVGSVVKGVDQSLRNQGAGINKLLTTTSAVVESPDRAVGDIGSITKNLALLTSTVRAINPTVKETLTDAERVAPDLAQTAFEATSAIRGIITLISLVADLERELGPELQQLLDVVSVVVRKGAARAPFYASLANVVPRVLNGIANFVQTRENSGFLGYTIRYRPPLYRVRTPNGAFQCGYMNAAMPGSCANVNGTPYAVDVALLQYVLTMAAKR